MSNRALLVVILVFLALLFVRLVPVSDCLPDVDRTGAPIPCEGWQ